MKQGKRRLRWILAGPIMAFLLVLVLYVSASWVLTLVRWPVQQAASEAPKEKAVWLVYTPIHTDIYLYHEDLQRPWLATLFPEQPEKAPPTYWGFGWGEKAFLLETPTWGDLTLQRGASALFWPTPSAMHVYCRDELAINDPQVYRLSLTTHQLNRLETYIWESFSIAPSGHPRQYPGYGPYEDYFFDARGDYHLIFTCNQWTNQALRAAGVKTSIWTPFTWNLKYHFH